MGVRQTWRRKRWAKTFRFVEAMIGAQLRVRRTARERAANDQSRGFSPSSDVARALRVCAPGLGGCELLVDPGVCLNLFESPRGADLSGEEFPCLQIQPPLAIGDLRRYALPGLCFAAHPVAHDLRKLEQIASHKFRLRLLHTLGPTLLAGLAGLMQRLLHPLQIRVARNSAKPHTRLRDRERHDQAVPELDDDDFLLNAGKRSSLPCYHSAHPIGGIHDRIANGQPHTETVAAASLVWPGRG